MKNIKILLFISIFFSTIGCKKELNTDISFEIKAALKLSVSAYIDSVDHAISGVSIKKENIPWDQLEVKALNGLKKMVYLPLSFNDINGSSKALVAIVNSSDNSVQTVFFSQINFDDKQNTKTTKAFYFESVYNFFAKIDAPFHGNMQFYELNNSPMFEFGYYSKKGGKYFKATSANIPTSQQGLIKTTSCTSYYLVTYYDDGSSDREFLFDDCDNPIPCNEQTSVKAPTEDGVFIKSNCAVRGSGGGSGGITALIINDLQFFNLNAKDNGDGTTTYTLISSQGLPILSSGQFTFTLDANRKLVYQPTYVLTSPMLTFTPAPLQNPAIIDVTYYTNSLLFPIYGTATAFGTVPFQWKVELEVKFQGNLAPVARPTYGYSRTGRNFIN